MRNCTRDEGGPFEVGNQVLISNHRKLLRSKAVVVNVAETPGRDSGRHGRERRAQANRCRSAESDEAMSEPGGDPCMGLLLSRGSAVQRMFLSFVSFLVRSESPFLRPDPQQRQAVARRSCQGWPLQQPFDMPRPGPGHTLT